MITVAARASKLSRAQVEEVLAELKKLHPEVEFLSTWVKTRGDLDLTTSLRTLDKTDFFTREIDQLLLARKCRIAIHSAKDLPEPLLVGLKCVALTQGVDPSDSLVLPKDATLSSLPNRARIGTSSVRREAMIKALRTDLCPVDIRGTIEQRLALLEQGKLEGVVVAEAALIRLKLLDLNRVALPGETAPLQGRLAIIAHEEDQEMEALFKMLSHEEKKR